LQAYQRLEDEGGKIPKERPAEDFRCHSCLCFANSAFPMSLCAYTHVIGGIIVQLSYIFQLYTRKTALISYMSQVFSACVGNGRISISFRPRSSRLYTIVMHLFHPP
jgi:hypothetical protein